MMNQEKQTAEMARMAEFFQKQPKVRIRIPKNELSEEDCVVPVCINGYNFFLRRGESLEVPQTVAELLEEASYI